MNNRIAVIRFVLVTDGLLGSVETTTTCLQISGGVLSGVDRRCTWPWPAKRYQSNMVAWKRQKLQRVVC